MQFLKDSEKICEIINDPWETLNIKYGFNRVRILAHAVSWAFRPDNWQFPAWYKYLKDKELVDLYFNDMLKYELGKMFERGVLNITPLIERYQLPPIVKIYGRPENKVPYKPNRRKRRWL